MRGKKALWVPGADHAGVVQGNVDLAELFEYVVVAADDLLFTLAGEQDLPGIFPSRVGSTDIKNVSGDFNLDCFFSLFNILLDLIKYSFLKESVKEIFLDALIKESIFLEMLSF